MELNEIKKILYKEKQLAIFVKATSVSLLYRVDFLLPNDPAYFFHIPITDIGDAEFLNFMPSQQLIRWLVIPETNNK